MPFRNDTVDRQQKPCAETKIPPKRGVKYVFCWCVRDDPDLRHFMQQLLGFRPRRIKGGVFAGSSQNSLNLLCAVLRSPSPTRLCSLSYPHCCDLTSRSASSLHYPPTKIGSLLISDSKQGPAAQRCQFLLVLVASSMPDLSMAYCIRGTNFLRPPQQLTIAARQSSLLPSSLYSTRTLCQR